MPEGTIKIGLGTAQFGLDYGITNKSGIISDADLELILSDAFNSGIDVLDTAQSYGTAERRLGEYLSQNKLPYRITTKFSLPKKSTVNKENIRAQIEGSFERLRTRFIDSLLLHDVSDIHCSKSDVMCEVLNDLKQEGKIKNLGVSIYSSDEIDSLLPKLDIDLVQLPYNLLDTRLEKSGHLAKLKNKGIEIHARSAFLQGVLLSHRDNLPYFLTEISPVLDMLDELALVHRVSRQSILLSGCSPLIDRFIIGVNDLKQYEQFKSALHESKKLGSIELSPLPILPDEILDPRCWPSH